MTDLHKLLHEPWAPSDEIACDENVCPPLSQRLPECVPEGLEWNGEQLPGSRIYGWMLFDSTRGDEKWHHITDAHAELMCIGKWVKVLGETGWGLSRWNDANLHKPMWEIADSDGKPVAAREPSLLAALAAALHRLCDERHTNSAQTSTRLVDGGSA